MFLSKEGKKDEISSKFVPLSNEQTHNMNYFNIFNSIGFSVSHESTSQSLYDISMQLTPEQILFVNHAERKRAFEIYIFN